MKPTQSGLRYWFKENIRIIISVIIVLAMAFGIYSYSERTLEEMPQDPHKERTECLQYGDQPLQQIPAKCVQYFSKRV